MSLLCDAVDEKITKRLIIARISIHEFTGCITDSHDKNSSPKIALIIYATKTPVISHSVRVRVFCNVCANPLRILTIVTRIKDKNPSNTMIKESALKEKSSSADEISFAKNADKKYANGKKAAVCIMLEVGIMMLP